MKLGISYNLFDCEELLESSIKQIRSEVDYINVVYQKISNFGQECSPELIPLLEDLKLKGLIDELFEYQPVFNNGPHYNEITKRNIGLDISKNAACTHHMSMDSDELYKTDEFRNMKKIVEEGDYDSSSCQMSTYYKTPTHRLDPKEDYYVTLIFKIEENKKFIMGFPFPTFVDPTRRMPTIKTKMFRRNQIEMHHMSYVRKDISTKITNSSARMNFNQYIPEFLDKFNNWKDGDDALLLGSPPKSYKLVKVENTFNILLNEEKVIS
jgi:hypothetical protein